MVSAPHDVPMAGTRIDVHVRYSLPAALLRFCVCTVGAAAADAALSVALALALSCIIHGQLRRTVPMKLRSTMTTVGVMCTVSILKEGWCRLASADAA